MSLANKTSGPTGSDFSLVKELLERRNRWVGYWSYEIHVYGHGTNRTRLEWYPFKKGGSPEEPKVVEALRKQHWGLRCVSDIFNANL